MIFSKLSNYSTDMCWNGQGTTVHLVFGHLCYATQCFSIFNIFHKYLFSFSFLGLELLWIILCQTSVSGRVPNLSCCCCCCFFFFFFPPSSSSWGCSMTVENELHSWDVCLLFCSEDWWKFWGPNFECAKSLAEEWRNLSDAKER
jgi:hypothetical protein